MEYCFQENLIFGQYTREELVSKILMEYDLEILIAERLIIPTFSLKSQNSLLNQYYNGDFKKSSIARFQTRIGVRNFLMTQEKYKKRGSNYYIDDILEIPETLYDLQRIEQGEFQQLNGKDIREQLALFTLTKKNEVSMEELQKMDACGITENVYFKISDKAKKDAYVLKLMKK